MGKSDIPEIMLSCGAVQFSANDTIPVVVSFSVLGGIRDAFNEENWTKAYDKNDNTFKMKYGIKIHSGMETVSIFPSTAFIKETCCL